MAIAFDAVSTYTSGATASTGFNWSHSCAGSDRLLLIGITGNGSMSGLTVTYDGNACTPIPGTPIGTTYYSVASFYLVNPPTGSNVINVTSSSSRSFASSATSWSGIDQSASIGTVASQVDAVGSSLISVVATSDTDQIVAAFAAYRLSSATVSPVSGETVHDLVSGGSGTGLSSYRHIAASEVGASTTTISFNVTSSVRWSIVAIPLIPAAASGTAHALAGVMAGTSTVSGSLALSLPLSATVASTSTVTGTLSRAMPVSGAIAATSNVTGSLGLSRPLTSTITGTSAVSGALALTRPLSGIVASTSTVTGATTLAAALSGTVAGTSAVTGSLARSLPFTGAVASISAVTGSIAVSRPLAGAVTSTAAVTGDLGLAIPLSGAVSSTSAITGSIETTAEVTLAGIIAGTNATTGDLAIARALVGTITASNTVTGDVGLALPLSGAIHGDTGITGDMAVAMTLAGTVDATATMAGLLTVTPAFIQPDPLHVVVTRTFDPMPVSATRTVADLPVAAVRTVQPLPIAVTREFDQ